MESQPKPSQFIDGSRWIKAHGNVLTKLEVVDAADPERISLRVVRSDRGSSYKTGQVLSMSTQMLALYYKPVSR